MNNKKIATIIALVFSFASISAFSQKSRIPIPDTFLGIKAGSTVSNAIAVLSEKYKVETKNEQTSSGYLVTMTIKGKKEGNVFYGNIPFNKVKMSFYDDCLEFITYEANFSSKDQVVNFYEGLRRNVFEQYSFKKSKVYSISSDYVNISHCFTADYNGNMITIDAGQESGHYSCVLDFMYHHRYLMNKRKMNDEDE